MKICSLCKVEKDLLDFNKKGKVGFQPYCRLCQRIKFKQLYQNPEFRIKVRTRILKNNYLRIARNKEYVNNIKLNNPCKDCNQFYNPWQMDFDHIESNKSYNISQMLSENLNKIKKEIQKCDLVCANCHRNRTHKRLQSTRVN